VEIPRVEQTVRRPITNLDLLNLRDFHGSQISPDGRWVAFVLGQAVTATNNYRTGLFVVSTDRGSIPVSLGNAGPPHRDDINQWWPENPQWSADSKTIYYRLKSASSWQVWKWKREGGSPVQVTHLERDVRAFQVMSDGANLLLSVNKPSQIDREQLAMHGILYDGSVRPGAAKPLLDTIIENSPVETENWLHDMRSGHERRTTDEDVESLVSWDYAPNVTLFDKKDVEDHLVGRAAISPDGKNVVYERTLENPDESAQMSYPLFVKSTRSGKPVGLTPELYIADQFWWSHDSKAIYYSYNDNVGVDDARPSKLMVVSSTGGKPRQVLDSPGYQHDYSVDRSGRLLACIYDNTTTPPELKLVELSTGEVRTLVDVNPEFRNFQLGSTKRIDVSSKYGGQFWGHLVLPVDYVPGKRYPLVITTYRDGDTFLRGGAGDEYPILVFAANGFAVLNFDFGRVRNSEPANFERQILFWTDPIDGMEASIAKLADGGIIDRSRVAITGLSHGAEMVNYAISHTDLFRAAIASGPGWDPLDYYLSDSFFRAYLSKQFHLESPDGESRGRWQKVAPALNADRVQTPLLINAADSEYTYGMQFVTALRELKRPVEMFVYPDELHVKHQPMHRYEIYERNVDWLKFWLYKQEDPDPVKSDQYKRWRALRTLKEGEAADVK
jgi:dipeptidyl aminopeptidase/acylaminoacyl peptidase